MQTHLTGPIIGSRLGAANTVLSFLLDVATYPSATNVKICTIDASPAKPVAYRPNALVLTPGSAGSTTVVFNLGTTAGGSGVLSGNAKGAVGSVITPTQALSLATAPTDIWASFSSTGTLPTIGQILCAIEMFEFNVAPI